MKWRTSQIQIPYEGAHSCPLTFDFGSARTGRAPGTSHKCQCLSKSSGPSELDPSLCVSLSPSLSLRVSPLPHGTQHRIKMLVRARSSEAGWSQDRVRWRFFWGVRSREVAGKTRPSRHWGCDGGGEDLPSGPYSTILGSSGPGQPTGVGRGLEMSSSLGKLFTSAQQILFLCSTPVLGTRWGWGRSCQRQ